MGYGRCRLHGGASPRGPHSPHYKHGKRCRPLLPDQRELEQFAETFDPVDLTDEALLASYFSQRLAAQRDAVECPQCGTKVELEVPPPLFWRAVNVAGLTKKRQAEIKRGTVVRYVLDTRDLDPFLDALIEVLREHVSDPDEREAAIAALLSVKADDENEQQDRS